MRDRKDAIGLFAVSAVFCGTADLLSKAMVTNWVEDRGGLVVLIPGWLQFVYRINEGAMWSAFRELGATANTFLGCFSIVASVAILVWAWIGLQKGDRILPIILGMILGGAIGNVHDRIVFGGVRDFIEAHYDDVYYFPTFNVADSCLVCGAILLAITSIFSKSPSAIEDSPVMTCANAAK